jgi:transketolase
MMEYMVIMIDTFKNVLLEDIYDKEDIEVWDYVLLILTAAGMAVKGMHPIAYSMSCFLPSRAFEQIKVSVGYQKLPVVIVGVGSGLSYGDMGSTHHAMEESALMRSVPNLNVIFPGNAIELEGALRTALADNKPYYISYPKAMAPKIEPYPFEMGKAVCHRNGADGVIFGFGFAVNEAIAASDLLKEKGIHLAVYGLHTVKPLDR